MTYFDNHSYTITWITTPEELEENPVVVDDFFALYQDPANFPDPDELEDPEFIRQRVATGNANPHTHLLAFHVVGTDGIRKLAGGSIVEFYPDSCCVLVTYLFVHSAYRGGSIQGEERNIAETIIHSEHGLTGLFHQLEKIYGKTIKAVFFESNNPFETDPAEDSMPPAMRLRFFSRNGGVKVNFDYLQPPLDDDKEIVTNMYLLCFPAITGLSDTIPIKVVIGFVMELAKSLDQNKAPGSSACYGWEHYLHDRDLISNSENLHVAGKALKGLSVQGRNVIREMLDSLIANSVQGDSVALISIPGAA